LSPHPVKFLEPTHPVGPHRVSPIVIGTFERTIEPDNISLDNRDDDALMLMSPLRYGMEFPLGTPHRLRELYNSIRQAVVWLSFAPTPHKHRIDAQTH
jgi:hypothetical protein